MSDRNLGPKSDPNLADLINKVKSDIFYSLNCVQIGTIETYDPATNTASISINFKRQLPTGDTLSYPLLAECPIFVLGGGGADISFPITSGDQCILLFNDRDISNWHYQGFTGVPDSPRSHSISDAMALVGIRNLMTATPTAINSVRIDAGDKKFSVINSVASLKTIVDALMTALTSLTMGPTGSISISPTSLAALSAVQASFDTLLDEGVV